MSKIAFQLTGDLQVNGESVNPEGLNHFVLMEGAVAASASSIASIANTIGLSNIAMATGNEDYLAALSPSEIREALIGLGIFDQVMYGTPEEIAA